MKYFHRAQKNTLSKNILSKNPSKKYFRKIHDFFFENNLEKPRLVLVSKKEMSKNQRQSKALENI